MASSRKPARHHVGFSLWKNLILIGDASPLLDSRWTPVPTTGVAVATQDDDWPVGLFGIRFGGIFRHLHDCGCLEGGRYFFLPGDLSDRLGVYIGAIYTPHRQK